MAEARQRGGRAKARAEAEACEQRIAALEGIVRDTLWMARRYAHGRQNYAVGLYNAAARRAMTLDIARLDMPDGSAFALDGMDDGAGRPGFSGLSAEEFAAAAAGLNEQGTTPHPDRFSPAGRRKREAEDVR